MPDKDNANQPTPELTPEILPEETEETPENLTPADIGDASGSFNIPPLDDSSLESDGKKKIFLIIGAVLLFVVIFFTIMKVIFSLRGSNKAITLEYWGLWEDEKIFQTVIQDYKRDNPNISIKYIKQDPKRYREKLLAQGKEGRGPDIFRFHNTWLPSISEIAAPVPKTIMTHDEFDQTFYKIVQQDLKIGDSYHGLPLEIDGLVLVYNGQLFKKAGITNAPQTWEDLIRDANTLRVQDSAGNILTSGISLGTSNNIEHFSDIMGWMLIQNGADIRQLSAPEAVQVLIDYRRFAEPPLNFWNEKMPNNINAFVQEKVGMIIVPSWQIIEIMAANQNLDVKVAQLPILPGSQPLSLASYWVEGVSRTGKHQEEAWKFLKYLIQKETMQKIYKAQAETRLFGEPYSRVDLRDKLIQNEYIGPVLEQAPFMKSLPMIARTYDNGLNDQINTYMNDAVNATIQGVSYDQAMGTAAQGVEQVFQQFGVK